MKKIISISLVFALIAGAAFADANVSGAVFGNVELMKGDSGEFVNEDGVTESDQLLSGGSMKRIRAEFAGESEDGVFGAWARLEPTLANGLVWWKPMDMLKLQIGVNPDGHFGADGVARWGFYAGAGDIGVAREDWEYGASFFGGYGMNGAIITLTPMDGLDANIGLPFITYADEPDGLAWAHFNAQVGYNIENIGRFALTYAGNTNKFDEKALKKAMEDLDPTDPDDAEEISKIGQDAYKTGSTLFVYFGLTAIENLSIDLGLGFTFPVTTDDKSLAGEGTYNAPLAIGLGVNFTSGDFGVKVRFQAKLGESYKPDVGDEYKGPAIINADLLPSFAINEDMTAYLSAGLKITSYDADDKWANGDSKDALVGWHINPYIVVKGTFFAGFRLDSTGEKFTKGKPDYKDGDAVVNWSIPIGIAFSF